MLNSWNSLGLYIKINESYSVYPFQFEPDCTVTEEETILGISQTGHPYPALICLERPIPVQDLNPSTMIR